MSQLDDAIEIGARKNFEAGWRAAMEALASLLERVGKEKLTNHEIHAALIRACNGMPPGRVKNDGGA